MLERAHGNGIEKIICIGTNHEDSLAARDFASLHDGVYWTYGIHPEGACKSGPDHQTLFRAAFGRPVATGGRRSSSRCRAPEALQKSSDGHPIYQSPIAIGEVGLDYHYEGYNREAQIRLFEEMLQLAVDNDLPLSFHVREAFDDFFPVVANFPGVRGVVHSFSDNKKNLKRILNETEFYVGVNGMATYSTLPTPPLERILLETDAPFLTPVPFRGIINECAYIRNIAEWLAAKLSISFDVIEEATTQNAEQLFKF